MRSFWYIAACVLIPAIWGLIVGLVYDRLAERGKKIPRDETEPAIYSDYEI